MQAGRRRRCIYIEHLAFGRMWDRLVSDQMVLLALSTVTGRQQKQGCYEITLTLFTNKMSNKQMQRSVSVVCSVGVYGDVCVWVRGTKQKEQSHHRVHMGGVSRWSERASCGVGGLWWGRHQAHVYLIIRWWPRLTKRKERPASQHTPHGGEGSSQRLQGWKVSTEYIPHIDPTIITDETVCRVRSHIVIFFIASAFCLFPTPSWPSTFPVF